MDQFAELRITRIQQALALGNRQIANAASSHVFKRQSIAPRSIGCLFFDNGEIERRHEHPKNAIRAVLSPSNRCGIAHVDRAETLLETFPRAYARRSLGYATVPRCNIGLRQ